MPRYLIEFWYKGDFDEEWVIADTEVLAHEEIQNSGRTRTNLKTIKTEP